MSQTANVETCGRERLVVKAVKMAIDARNLPTVLGGDRSSLDIANDSVNDKVDLVLTSNEL